MQNENTTAAASADFTATATAPAPARRISKKAMKKGAIVAGSLATAAAAAYGGRRVYVNTKNRAKADEALRAEIAALRAEQAELRASQAEFQGAVQATVIEQVQALGPALSAWTPEVAGSLLTEGIGQLVEAAKEGLGIKSLEQDIESLMKDMKNYTDLVERHDDWLADLRLEHQDTSAKLEKLMAKSAGSTKRNAKAEATEAAAE